MTSLITKIDAKGSYKNGQFVVILSNKSCGLSSTEIHHTLKTRFHTEKGASQARGLATSLYREKIGEA